MKFNIKTFIMAIFVMGMHCMASPAIATNVKVTKTVASRVDDSLRILADINLDAVKLGSNSQLYITPVIEDNAGNSLPLPSLMVNGHAMQIAYERKSLPGNMRKNHDVIKAVKRNNGKDQTVNYLADIPLSKWMWNPKATIRWTVDTCGCGYLHGSAAGVPTGLNLNPAAKMRVAFITPEVTELPVAVHEGKALVRFEVSKSDLHTEPYICRNGQRIDNRSELKVIDDSISYALSDKNVEIAKIKICGYASPEGSYLNNQQLSTDRSRALSEYIASKYKLPADKSEFDAVAENWDGFKDIVKTSPLLSVSQRKKLLELIDRPAYGPSDWDAKERELRTDPQFSSLYKNTILPEWFPELRATRFEISTRLKPLSDEELAEVMEHTPEKMSLNQMFRVARLYPEDSDRFNNAISTALRFYPEDPTSNLNMASALLKKGDFKEAKKYLEKAGNTPEAFNSRGIIAAWEGELDIASEMFTKAGALPEAAKNAEMAK